MGKRNLRPPIPLISVAAERLERTLASYPDLPNPVVDAARELLEATAPPKRGERCLNPLDVSRLMLDVSRRELEEFHVVLLDVRGRLINRVQIAVGSLTQCPVSPRDALRPAVQVGAHGVVFVHNHPSGDPSPSADDFDLTNRLIAATELIGVLPRDHVIISSCGYYSFVESGRWRQNR